MPGPVRSCVISFPLAHQDPALANPVQSIEQRPPPVEVLDDRLHDAERRQVARQGRRVGTEVVPDAQPAGRSTLSALSVSFATRSGVCPPSIRTVSKKSAAKPPVSKSRLSHRSWCTRGLEARRPITPADAAAGIGRGVKRFAVAAGFSLRQIDRPDLGAGALPDQGRPESLPGPELEVSARPPQPPQVLEKRSVVGLHLPAIERLVPSGRRPGRGRRLPVQGGQVRHVHDSDRARAASRLALAAKGLAGKGSSHKRRAQATRRPSSPTSMVLTDGC